MTLSVEVLDKPKALNLTKAPTLDLFWKLDGVSEKSRYYVSENYPVDHFTQGELLDRLKTFQWEIDRHKIQCRRPSRDGKTAPNVPPVQVNSINAPLKPFDLHPKIAGLKPTTLLYIPSITSDVIQKLKENRCKVKDAKLVNYISTLNQLYQEHRYLENAHLEFGPGSFTCNYNIAQNVFFEQKLYTIGNRIWLDLPEALHSFTQSKVRPWTYWSDPANGRSLCRSDVGELGDLAFFKIQEHTYIYGLFCNGKDPDDGSDENVRFYLSGIYFGD